MTRWEHRERKLQKKVLANGQGKPFKKKRQDFKRSSKEKVKAVQRDSIRHKLTESFEQEKL